MRISIGDSRQEPASVFVLDHSLLPGTRIELTELCDSGNVRIKSAVYVDDLTRNISALIGSKVYTHISDILRTTIAINHNVACENIFEHLWNVSVVFRRYNQPGTHTIATDILFTVLQRCILREFIHARFGAGVGGGT